MILNQAKNSLQYTTASYTTYTFVEKFQFYVYLCKSSNEENLRKKKGKTIK